MTSDIYSRLQHQSLGRPLTDSERALASAIEAVFSTGQHDFKDVVRALEQEGVRRPSGAPGPWTLTVLEQELEAINHSLDAAYGANGISA